MNIKKGLEDGTIQWKPGEEDEKNESQEEGGAEA